MIDDAELLRRYADANSESAFTELVQRHVDLVYSAALRRTGGNVHTARDVAQQVFTTLAREARKLSRHTILSAWLHTATRNAALNLMIAEQRRRTREAVALGVQAADAAAPEWEQLRPVLDSAIDELPEPDRAAVVLRYLERESFARIGATLRVSEDAARMRTERALEKLRSGLARRGVTSTAAALGLLVTNQAIVASPAGLAVALAQGALVAAAGGIGLAAFLSSLVTTKIIATAVVSGALAFAAGGYLGMEHTRQAPLPAAPELPQHSQLIADLRKENASLRASREQLSAANAKLSADLASAATRRPPAAVASAGEATTPPEVAVRQRAVLNNLRQIAAAIDQFMLEKGRAPASLDELVGETKYIRRLNAVHGETYAGLVLGQGQPMTVMMVDGVTVTYDPKGTQTTRVKAPPPTPEQQRFSELDQKVRPAIAKATAAYRMAKGKEPKEPEEVLAYFATPQEGADFVEWIEAKKAQRNK
jgi:RNA polymerase sigma factor (sigma-70 family)